jgi:superfamily I DNA/RNA helicase
VVQVARAALGDHVQPPVRSRQPEGPPVEVHRQLDELDEARAVAQRIRDARACGVSWGSQAVLARTRAQVRQLAAALEQLDVPCRVRIGEDEVETDADATVRLEAPTPFDAVDVVTFHAAKGLEWRSVHVTGLEAGFVPISHAGSSEAIDEERRLLYVALTRAREELRCSWAERRTFGDRSVTRRPSPWLAAIEQCLVAQAERPTVDWRAHLAEGRARLEAANHAS